MTFIQLVEPLRCPPGKYDSNTSLLSGASLSTSWQHVYVVIDFDMHDLQHIM